MDDIKKNRMEHQILEKISMMILTGSIKDPRVGPLLSLTRVKVTNDSSHATIYVSSIQSDASVDKAVEALNHAAGYIQNQLGKTLKSRNTPRLHFKHDTSLKESFEMNKLIEGLHHKQD